MHKRLGIIIIFILLAGCVRLAPGSDEWKPIDPAQQPTSISSDQISATASFKLPPPRLPGSQDVIPTPDLPHALPTQRSNSERYVVQYGDTLGQIAEKYSVSLDSLMQANNISNPNALEIGQILNIPVVTAEMSGSALKLIPDSELVYGPMSITLDISQTIKKYDGFLAGYSQQVDDVTMDAAQVILRVSQDYSVNPRILLAVLENRAGWLTKTSGEVNTSDYPIGFEDGFHSGLYRQLAITANTLNRGFYLWGINGMPSITTIDGNLVRLDATINAGTAAVQYLFSKLDNIDTWKLDISNGGFLATYTALFGNPFDYSIDPLVPGDLAQPVMDLPFQKGETWEFTGGPHGGWDTGSAWAAIDFAPPGEAMGCVTSNAWVTAMADGLITRAGNGAVIQDLDGDGYEQTGWVVLYMHIATLDRILPGSLVHAGDKIGHPSCEGGVSDGTHTHLARKFNGVWISADGKVPFDLSGWISKGTGIEYDGFLERNGSQVEAFAGNSPINLIQR